MLVSELIQELSLHLHDPARAVVNDGTLRTFINSAARDAQSAGWLRPIEEAESIVLVAETWMYEVPIDFAYVNHLRMGNATLASGDTVVTGVLLEGAITDTTTELTSVDSTGFVQVNDIIQVDDEMFLVRAINASDNQLTLTRGYAGTTAATHLDNAPILDVGTTIEYDDVIPRAYWRAVQNDGVAQFIFDSRLFSFTAGIAIKTVGQKRPSLYTSNEDTIDAGMESFIRERTVYYGSRFAAGGGSEFSREMSRRAEEAFSISEAMLGNVRFRVKPSSVIVPGR